MGDTLTTFSPLQKKIYTGIIESHLNNKNQLWSWFEKRGADGGQLPAAGSSTEPAVGRYFTVHNGRNTGGGFTDPDGTYPIAGAQGYSRGVINPRTLHFPINVSKSGIRNTRTDAAAYGRLMVESATRAANDVGVKLERVICGDGSGTLGSVASIGAYSGGSAYTLTNPADARKFFVGQVITGFSARTANSTWRVFAAGVNYATITAVDPTAGTVTMTNTANNITGATIAAGDVLVEGFTITTGPTYSASRSTSPTTIRYEPMGIDGIVSDRDSPMETGTTYGGLYGILAPADYSGSANTGGVTSWASYVNRVTSGTSRAYNDTILQSLKDRIEIDSGLAPDIYVTSYGGRVEFVNARQAIRRTVNTMTIAGETGGGFSENTEAKQFVEFDGKPIVPSRFAPVGRDANTSGNYTTSFLALNTSHIWVEEWHKLRFIDDDGNTWRMVGRTPFFEAILEYQCEVAANRRNCHAKATQIIASDFT